MATSKKSNTPDTAPESTATPVPVSNAQGDLAAMFGEILKQNADTLKALQENTPKREMSYDEYLQLPETKEFNKQLKKPAFQNGREVNPHGLSDATIDKLANLQPGRYIHDMVTVVVNDKRGEEAIHLLYKSATISDRMTFQQYVRSFADMVDQIYAEMQSKDAQ